MSVVEGEQANFDEDVDSDDNFRNEDNGFHQGGQFTEDDHFSNEESMKQLDYHQSDQIDYNAVRHPRPMRPQNAPMQYRPGPGPRPPFPPGFRGPPRMPMQMPNNSRMPFMRPGMGPNRNGPPFENYGPPQMNMPRGCPPPRFPQQPQGRFPPMNENQNEEEMEDQQQSCNDMGQHDYDQSASNSFQNPGMRFRGPPPPFMMGPNGGPHSSGPHSSGPPPGVPHGPPRNGPPGGPPFNGPPGQNYGGPPGPHFNGPPMSSPNGPPFPGTSQPNMSGPNSGPPFSGPHSGPPFSGPPFGAPQGPSMSGPPGHNFTGPPPGQGYGGPSPTPDYVGPPASNFNNQPSGPPFSGASGPNFPGMNRPPFGAPFNMPPGPPGSAPPGGAPPGGPPPGSAPPGSAPPGSAPPGSAPPGSAPPGSAPPGPPPSSLPPAVPPPGPPVSCPPMGGPPPGVPPSGMPPSAPPGHFSGPPGHMSSQAPITQSAHHFNPSDTMHGPPPGAPTAPPFTQGPPRPPFIPTAPHGTPTSTATSQQSMVPTSGVGAVPAPAMCPPPVQQTASTTTASPFGYPTGPVVTSESSPYPMPPGFPGVHPVAARPLGVPPQPLCAAPPGVPLHFMPPPPMSTMPVMPPGIPPFRHPMPFMPPGMQMSAMPPRMPQMTPMNVGEDIWVENLTAEGKSYYYNMRTRETRWDRPEGVTLVKQDEVENPAKPTVANTSVGSVTTTTISTTPSATPKPPEVLVWTEYHNPEGKAYYHNTKTGETTWEKPKVLVDWEASAARASTMSSSETKQPQAPSVNTVQSTPVTDSKPAASSVGNTKQEEVQSTTEKMDTSEKNENSSTNGPTENKEEATKAPKDNSRPVSSTAVPGTPWCVVWTGDDRAFFFNPSQRLSVWEKPEELKGRADVDRLLEKRPNPNTTPNAVANDEHKVTPVTQDDADDSSSAAKKPRLDADPSTTEPSEDFETLKKDSNDDSNDGEKANVAPDKIPVGMEAAKEAEERAARERAVQPLEVRVKRFREMLVEMQVSAFSTWEKELHKIVFDPRYLLLTSKERRQTFETYVKERAEEERREKKNKMKERKEKFIELLEEAGLNSKSSFSDFSAKYQKDERFKGIDKARDRESMFQDYLTELRKREKDEKHREKEKSRTDFMNLLKEQKTLSKHSHWSDVKRKIHSDPRYKAVESSSRREDWFREYIRKLDEVPSREDSGTKREREKRERQEASLREREREVKEALSSSMREREKERDQQLRNEQETTFRTMLLDIIRDPNATWKEAKKALRKDSRWESVGDVLPRAEKDEIFKEHLAALAKKTRDVLQKSSDLDREKRNSTSDAVSEERSSVADDLSDGVEKRESSRR